MLPTDYRLPESETSSTFLVFNMESINSFNNSYLAPTACLALC